MESEYELKINTSSTTQLTKPADNHPPLDCNQGWGIVGVAVLVMFLIYGVLYSYSVLLLYYLKSGLGTQTGLSFVPTINTSLIGLLSVFTSRLDEKFGHRKCIFLGGLGYSLGMFLSSFSTKLWHLMLTQGVIMGACGSMIYIATLSAPLQWFDKKRGLACGLTMAGSGLGGLFLPPLFQKAIPAIGIGWTLRLYSLVVLIVLCLASLVIKERVDIKKTNQTKEMVDLTLFKEPNFLLLFFGVMICTLGYMVPILMMAPYGESKGLTGRQTSILIATINGCSAFGRILFGSLGDLLGPINILAVCLTFTCSSCLLLWSLASKYTTLLCFAVIYGLFIGGFVSMVPVITTKLFFDRGVAKVNGLVYFGTAIPSLVGAPIAFALVGLVSKGKDVANYLPAIIYSGMCGLFGLVFFTCLLYRVKYIATKKHHIP